MYRLDSTAFKPQTVEQAAKSHAEFYKALIWQERLKITNYLNSIVFNYPEQRSSATRQKLLFPLLQEITILTKVCLTSQGPRRLRKFIICYKLQYPSSLR